MSDAEVAPNSVSLPEQRVIPGRLETAYRREWSRLRAGDAIAKIWAKQPVSATTDAAQGRVAPNRLGWLGMLDRMRAESGRLTAFVQEIAAAGLCDVVLLGMDTLNSAARAFCRAIGGSTKERHFFILDTIDPSALMEVSRAVDLPRALFVVAGKAGNSIETLSQFAYFQDQLRRAAAKSGVKSSSRTFGENFIAITDSDSYLDALATTNYFRRIFRNPPHIRGRYAALSFLGLVPAALCGVDVSGVLNSAIEMRMSCSPSGDTATNPALHLGALLSAAAKQGDNRVILLASPKLAVLGNWVTQVIAVATGKGEPGLVPLACDAASPMDAVVSGSVTIGLALAGDDDVPLAAALRDLAKRDAPVVDIRLASATEIGAEIFKWEAATAVTCAALDIDPFDDSFAREGRNDTASILEEFQVTGKMPLGTPRLRASGIELYAGADMRRNISVLGLASALRTFFAGRREGDYLGLLAYVPRDPTNIAALHSLRASLQSQLGLPVLLGHGPSYISSLGQDHRGGSSLGRFLLITSQTATDLAIPGAKYTFGELEMAQALGDLQSLTRRGRPVLRVHLSQGAHEGLPVLRNTIDQALAD